VDGSETLRQIYARATKATIDIVAANQDKVIVAAAHSTLLSMIVPWAEGLSVEHSMDKNYWIDNTGITRIDFDEFFKPTVVSFNDCSHLNADNGARCLVWTR